MARLTAWLNHKGLGRWRDSSQEGRLPGEVASEMTSQVTHSQGRAARGQKPPQEGEGSAPPPPMVSDPAYACLAFPPCAGNWRFRVGFQAAPRVMQLAEIAR